MDTLVEIGGQVATAEMSVVEGSRVPERVKIWKNIDSCEEDKKERKRGGK